MILKTSFAKFTASEQAEEASQLQFKVGAHIDHAEHLDEQAESVDVHGAVHFRWTNPHFAWNITAFPIDRITRVVGEFLPYNPWTPRPTFNQAVHLGREKFETQDEFDYFQYEEASQLTIASDGSMTLSVPFSLRISCNFDFSSFPRDEHRCMLPLRVQHKLGVVSFDHDDAILHMLRTMPSNKRVGEFSYRIEYINLQHQKMCINAQCNDTFYNLAYSIGIAFTRQTWRYYGLFRIPLLICTFLAQFSMIVAMEYAFFIMSMVTYLFMLQLNDIGRFMPASSDGMPLIAIMYILLSSQMCLVFFARVFLVWLTQHCKRRKTQKVNVPFFKEPLGVERLIALFLHAAVGLFTAAITIGTLVIRSR